MKVDLTEKEMLFISKHLHWEAGMNLELAHLYEYICDNINKKLNKALEKEAKQRQWKLK